MNSSMDMLRLLSWPFRLGDWVLFGKLPSIAWLPMITSRRESAMLPTARIMCSRSARVIVFAINLPAFRRGQNAAKRIALPQALPFFGVVQQHLSNLLPGLTQNFQPFFDGGQRALLVPMLAA